LLELEAYGLISVHAYFTQGFPNLLLTTENTGVALHSNIYTYVYIHVYEIGCLLITQDLHFALLWYACHVKTRGAQSDHLRVPRLDLRQHIQVLLMLGAPEVDAGLQVGSHKSGVKGQNPLPQPAGHASVDAAQDTVCFLGCKCTLPAHGELLIHPYPQVLLRSAALEPLSTEPVLVFGITPTHVQDLALGLVELHEVHAGPRESNFLSTLYIPGHYILTSKHRYRLQVHRYICTYTCFLPLNIACTPLLCSESLQLASDLLKEVVYIWLFASPAPSELQALHVPFLPPLSFIQHYSALLSPILGPGCRFCPNYQLKCYNYLNLYRILISILT